MKSLYKPGQYTVLDQGIESISDHLLPVMNRSVLITDELIYSLYGKKLVPLLKPLDVITVPQGESCKTLEVAKQCFERLFELRLDRGSAVIALGGGSLTDLAGFVAASYMRGIPSIYIPTTLLAMVDAAIGGKTGVSLNSGKNLIGAFHEPAQVLINLEFLKTLPEREKRSGMAEVIKYGMALDRDLFEHLEERGAAPLKEIVEKCVRIKRDIVAEDFYDTEGIRQALNYGHTFGHAIEALFGYRTYRHGEAVSIGMSLSARLANELDILDGEIADRQDRLCRKFGLPVAKDIKIPLNELVSLMERDKKCQDGKIRLIVPKEIGTVTYYNMGKDSLRGALENITAGLIETPESAGGNCPLGAKRI